MKWNSIYVLSNKYLNKVIVFIVVIPIIVSIIKSIRLENALYRIINTYKIVLFGALLYLLANVLIKIFIPYIVKQYSTKKKYICVCCEDYGPYISRLFADNLLLNNVYKEKDIFPEYSSFFPIEKAIDIYSSKEIVSVYSGIEYFNENKSKPAILWLLSVMLIISTPMIFIFQIKNIIKIFGG